MNVKQERLFEGLPANLPETKLSEIVTSCAEEVLETGKKILPIRQNQVESFHHDVEAILQATEYVIKEPWRRSKKPHRNLVDAIQEILFHHPRYKERFLLILKEIPEQKKQRKPYKPWIPTQLSSIIMIRRDLLEEDPGPDVFCVIKSVKPRDKEPKRRRSRRRPKRTALATFSN